VIAMNTTPSTSQHAVRIERACRTIESSEVAPKLAALARQAGLSPYHFHRLFKAETGLTPQAYAAAHRARKLREALQDPLSSITDAIYSPGFGTDRRFKEASDHLLGMPAPDYRRGGAGARIGFAIGQCTLGAILVAQSQRGVCAILLGDYPQ